jgi:histidinol-phosphate aminotransferase
MAPSFIRPNIARLEGYAPGEQPGPGERFIKLNTNENPFPPSPRVVEAIRAIHPDALRRYPDPVANVFRDAAARLWGTSRDHVLAGNGSDDILTIATRTFVPPGGTLAYPDPTYSLYPVLAALEDAVTARVPWGEGYTLPIDALVATGASAVYLANPNAPTGTFVPPSTVAALAGAFPGLVLIDEAYADFADDHCVSLIERHENVVVSRTLSKAYGLAGLRFGYALAQPRVIQEMMKVKDSYNVDAVSIAAAAAALGDQDYARRTWEAIKAERARLVRALAALGYAALPSQANFVLCTVPGGDGRQAYLDLKRRGILVRFFDKPGLSDKLRITVGTREDDDALLAALAAR